MKRVVLFFGLLFSIGNSYSQSDLLHRVWLGTNLEYLAVGQTELVIEKPGFLPEKKAYTVLGDTLRIFYLKSQRNDNLGAQSKYYDFIVKKTD